jgi:hypothetical protein
VVINCQGNAVYDPSGNNSMARMSLSCLQRCMGILLMGECTKKKRPGKNQGR